MSSGNVIRNGGCLPLANLQTLSYRELSQVLAPLREMGDRLVTCFADSSDTGDFPLSIYAAVADAAGENIRIYRAEAAREEESLTPLYPQLHLFEREIAEQFGIVFRGHPWFKPVRFHASWPGKTDAWGRNPARHPLAGDMDYFRVEGEEVHEVGVGPVHAGIIEPGHFRFQCYGEEVLHLEISLGYQHRGIERLLAGGSWPQTPYQVETAAGDTSIGHMTAYSMIVEALSKRTISERAIFIRALALELERLANHVGDIGALAGDVGFLPTSAFCGRIRGDYLNMTAAICGSRFGRGLVRPGGVLADITPEIAEKLQKNLQEVASHTRGALNLFFETPSVLARLEGVGKVSAADASSLGMNGVAAKACGIDCDTRRHFPVGFYRRQRLDSITESGGDVYARAGIRQREIEQSISLANCCLAKIPRGPLRVPQETSAPESFALAMVEGWRGPVTHAAITDNRGRFSRYKIVDPSFFNWSGLAMALRNEQISDFPLCNKSFNLSYCGFDL